LVTAYNWQQWSLHATVEANVKLLTDRHHLKLSQGFSSSSVKHIQSIIEITDENNNKAIQFLISYIYSTLL